MLWGFEYSDLEVRKKGGTTTIGGRFPYNKAAVLSDGGRTGRPKKERFSSRAFSYRVNKPEEDIHFLVGHDFGKPLASRNAGTLELIDTDESLAFTAKITPEMSEVSYVQDFLRALSAGLIGGISPGFRIPPKRAVADAETIEDEGTNEAKGEFNALIRTVKSALLYELSAVTRPAYPETQIDQRSWTKKQRSNRLSDQLLEEESLDRKAANNLLQKQRRWRA